MNFLEGPYTTLSSTICFIVGAVYQSTMSTQPQEFLSCCNGKVTGVTLPGLCGLCRFSLAFATLPAGCFHQLHAVKRKVWYGMPYLMAHTHCGGLAKIWRNYGSLQPFFFFYSAAVIQHIRRKARMLPFLIAFRAMPSEWKLNKTRCGTSW